MSVSAKGIDYKKRKELHPADKWTCPSCGVVHDHPHWADHHQTEKVSKDFCNGWCKESDSAHELDENGIPKPILCPKCGWIEDRLIFVKVEKGEIAYA